MGHGYVQHGGCEWRGSHRAWYHMYLTSENSDLPDAEAFEYEDDILVVFRADVLSVKKAGGIEETDVHIEASEHKSAPKVDEENSELSDANLDLQRIPDKE